MSELVDVAETALGGRRGPREPEDDLLFSLLSYQPLAVRRSAVDFAIEISVNLTAIERSNILELLELLIESYRHRHGSDRYAAYRPQPVDRARELAAYSANLVTLRVALEPGRSDVPLARIFRGSDDALQEWRSMVMLWRSALDADSQQAMSATLSVAGNSLILGGARAGIFLDAGFQDLNFARLMGDQRLEDRLRFGMAIRDGDYYFGSDPSDWANGTYSWLIPSIAGVRPSRADRIPPTTIPDDAAAKVAKLLMRLVKSGNMKPEDEKGILEMLFRLPRVFELDPYALAAAVVRNPALLHDIPQLNAPGVYGKAYGMLRLFHVTSPTLPAGAVPESIEVLLKGIEVNDYQLREGLATLIDEYLRPYLGACSSEVVSLFPVDEEP